MLFTPRNQNGTAPWSVVQRVVFRNNIVRHVSSVFNILGRDNEKPSQLTNDIEIRNNVFEDVSKATYGGDGRMMLINGGDNIRVRHNTSFNSGTALYGYGHAVTNFVLENNIVNYGIYGIMGENSVARKRHARHLVPERRRARQRHAEQPAAVEVPCGQLVPGELGGCRLRRSRRRQLPVGFDQRLHRRRHRWQHARG